MHISSSQNPLFCNFQPLHPTLSPAVGLVLGDFPPSILCPSVVMLGGVPDNARGVMGCTLRFLSQDIPRLYTLHPTLYTASLLATPYTLRQTALAHLTPKTHPKSVKNIVFTLFPCSVRFFFVPLRRKGHTTTIPSLTDVKQ